MELNTVQAEEGCLLMLRERALAIGIPPRGLRLAADLGPPEVLP